MKCSSRLFNDIKAHGGTPMMWTTGHSIIKAKMQEVGAPLAGEMSGHMFFADNWYGFDDAIYGSARFVALFSAQDKPMTELPGWPRPSPPAKSTSPARTTPSSPWSKR